MIASNELADGIIIGSFISIWIMLLITLIYSLYRRIRDRKSVSQPIQQAIPTPTQVKTQKSAIKRLFEKVDNDISLVEQVKKIVYNDDISTNERIKSLKKVIK